MDLSLAYPATLEADQNNQGYSVTFRDLPGVITEGDSYEEAIFNAREALELMLTDVDWNVQTIRDPSQAKKNEVMISVSPDIAAPILLHKLRERKGLTLAAVAHAMGVSYQSYQHIEAGKNLTLKSLKRAAAAMGANVEIRIHV